MSPAKTVTVTVTVAAGRVVYTHADHLDGAVHAPDPKQLADGGIPTASATAHREGARLKVPVDVADALAADGAVTRGK